MEQEKIDKYVESICECFGFEKSEFIKPRVSRNISSVRNIVYYILHKEMGFSLSKIARYFNRQIRAIVIANATIKFRLQNDFIEEINLYNKCKKR